MADRKPKRVLVTGSNGFAGGYLVQELLRNGYDVYGIDRSPSRRGTILPADHERLIDLADREAVRAMIEDFRPDAILHLAGWAHVGKSWQDPYGPFQANLINSINLYEAASRVMASKCCFIFVSSAEVFGLVSPDQMPIRHDQPVNPTSPYGVSKLAAEDALRALHDFDGPSLIVVRPFNHAGPGQSPDFALPSFASRIASIERGDLELFTHGNLDIRRDFLDVRDVARAYRLIMERGTPGGTYVVASGTSHTMKSIVERLFGLAGIDPRMKQDPALYREVDMKEFRGDSSRLTAETGWQPQIPFDKTLQDILDDARLRLQTA